jgi:hypothetical protein
MEWYVSAGFFDCIHRGSISDIVFCLNAVLVKEKLAVGTNLGDCTHDNAASVCCLRILPQLLHTHTADLEFSDNLLCNQRSASSTKAKGTMNKAKKRLYSGPGGI